MAVITIKFEDANDAVAVHLEADPPIEMDMKDLSPATLLSLEVIAFVNQRKLAIDAAQENV